MYYELSISSSPTYLYNIHDSFFRTLIYIKIDLSTFLEHRYKFQINFHQYNVIHHFIPSD